MTEPRARGNLWSSDRDAIIEDAQTSLGRTIEERWAMFCSIQRLVAATWECLSEAEVRRKMQSDDQLDPRPDPWWKNIRPKGLP